MISVQPAYEVQEGVHFVSKTTQTIHQNLISQPKNLTVTGASTRCTLPSSTNISRARRHNALTSFSRRYSHLLRRSICESSDDIDDVVLHIMLEVVVLLAVLVAVAAVLAAVGVDVAVDGAPTDVVF